MSRNYSNEEIDRLILLISKLPGFGPKSAGRVVLHLLKRKDQLMKPLSEALLNASEKIVNCEKCYLGAAMTIKITSVHVFR